MKSKLDVFKFVASLLVGMMCAFVAFALYALVDAHGHGITSGDKGIMILLAILSFVFFALSIKYFKK